MSDPKFYYEWFIGTKRELVSIETSVVRDYILARDGVIQSIKVDLDDLDHKALTRRWAELPSVVSWVESKELTSFKGGVL